jgi:hypothetical protein
VVDHKASVQFGKRCNDHWPNREAGKVNGHGETGYGGTRDMEFVSKRGSSRCKHCRGEVAVCVSVSTGISFAQGAQEVPYAVSKKVLARTTWVMRLYAGQFSGFWGSSGPSQSTTLSFVSCSIAVWSDSLECWWCPSSDVAGFSWADSESAAMIFYVEGGVTLG